jgi:hypothetical protein
MSTLRLLDEMDRLVAMLHDGRPVQLGAIPWASPVLAFGDPVRSRVATLGLNPSNLEFVDARGAELQAPHHRFESLTTLQADTWDQVAKRGVRKVWEACEDYFSHNPYDRWFMRLERIIVGTGASYYSRLGERACHLDLVPFATSKKWSSLTSAERAELTHLGTPSLAKTIAASDIRVLILNGSTVVREFSRQIPVGSLRTRHMPSWSLQAGAVNGMAFSGLVTEIGGYELDRKLFVLGYNHNIQSSWGVTSEVVARIASWIAQSAEGALA